MPLTQPPPSWEKITSKPTTVAGFGITDMAGQSVNFSTSANGINGTATYLGNSISNATVQTAAKAGPEITGPGGTAAAVMTFHRPLAYGVNFGLDNTNSLRVGGFSMGAKNLNVLHPASPEAPGDAPVYGCRAWVNFNGTGTVAIRASGNVSSITDNGTGDYTVNFTTAMSDANYSFTFGVGSSANTGVPVACSNTSTGPTTSSLRFYTAFSTSGSNGDFDRIAVAIHR